MEVMLALGIMGILLVGVIAGFQTTATVSGDAGRKSELQAALATVTDRVASTRYPGCVTPAAMTSVVRNAGGIPTGMVVDVTAMEGVVPAGPCTSATSAQLVTVVVTDPRGRGHSLRGQVVVRDRAAQAPS